MSLRDFKTDEQNEYYAGGLDENGGGSATCLIYPGEEEFDKANAANASAAGDGGNATAANASSAEAGEGAPPSPPATKFTGSARSLD